MKKKRSSSRVNIKTASWLGVLDSCMCWIFGYIGYLDILDIWIYWIYWIFGCVVYLDELVIIGLGIRLRQRFAGGGITGRI